MNPRWVARIAVAAGVVAATCAPAWTQPSVADRPHFIYGGDSRFPPYEYLDDRGQPQGFNVELLQRLAAVANIDIVVRLGPWAEMV